MRNIKKRNRTEKRILALLMSFCLLLGIFPGTAVAADGTGEGALVLDKQVEKMEDGFKLTLESYATGSNAIVTQKPKPLDIVLVLDESGSMADVLIHGCGNKNGTDVEVTPEGHLAEGAYVDDSLEETSLLFVGHKVFEAEIDTTKTYTVVYPADGTTRKIYYCPEEECQAWFSTTNHADHHEIAKWIPFGEENETPEVTHTSADWTCKVQFYEQCGKTGRDILQEALSGFLNRLCAAANPEDKNPVAHRVAIVGYGQGASYVYSDGTRERVYEDPGDGPGGSLAGVPEELAADAWCDVSRLDETAIGKWVNGVAASGSTPTHLGIMAAELAFQHAPKTAEDGTRAKVMILFTDGAPGGNYVNYGPGSSPYPDWVTPGIKAAKEMKDDGVTIYSVGLFPSANGGNAQSISYDATLNGQGAAGFFANANCFLHLVSSNYPTATGVVSGDWGALSDKYKEGENSYYLGTEDANDLSNIFNQVLEDVTDGRTTVMLDEEAVVRDVIADNFQIAERADSVTAWTESYQGDIDGVRQWEKDDGSESTNDSSSLKVTIDEKTVNVTGFDFAENFVHMGVDSQPAGKKLVVEILIEPTENTQGGKKLPTNETSSGIYENENSNTPVGQFPVPHVDLPTTVTIKKVVSGADSKEEFSFHAAYFEAGNYENIDSGVENGSNYLHFEEGTSITAAQFTLADDGTCALENVEVGSTLTIWEEAKTGWLTPTVTTSEGTQPLTPDAGGKYTVTVTPGMVITFTNTPVEEPDSPPEEPDPDPDNPPPPSAQQ